MPLTETNNLGQDCLTRKEQDRLQGVFANLGAVHLWSHSIERLKNKILPFSPVGILYHP